MRHSLNKSKSIDGFLIGSAIGFGMSILPALVNLIYSSGIEETKTLILIVWISATILGAIIGGTLALIAKSNLSQKEAINYMKKY